MEREINMIFGAPGCGKTTHLINTLKELLKEYEPNEIAFVSFTKKGSYEGRDRAVQAFNYKKEDFIYFRTLHSIAFRELGMSRYDMLSRRNYKDFSKSMGMNFLGYYTEDLVNNDDKYLFAVSLEKNNSMAYEQYKEDLDQLKLEFIKKNYSRFKFEMNIFDFDDLLLNFIKQKKRLPVKVAIIDEAQDLTTLQWYVCFHAFKNCEKIYIAGDDDQAIYQWSGADVNLFLNLTNKHPVKVLDKSYRLKKEILNLSKKVVTQIKERVDKNFDYDKGQGNIYYYNSVDDIVLNNEESWYFLARNNYFLPVYKNFIMKKGIPFSYKGDSYIKPSIYKSILLYEKHRKRFINEEIGRGKFLQKIHGDITLNSLLKKDVEEGAPWFDVLNLTIDDQNYYRNLFKNKADVKQNNLNVSTIHGVKGGEADNVVIMLDVTKNVFFNMQQSLDSELRCLYVGLTRAKKNLHIVHSNSKFGYEELL